jgi:hypothetical protein
MKKLVCNSEDVVPFNKQITRNVANHSLEKGSVSDWPLTVKSSCVTGKDLHQCLSSRDLENFLHSRTQRQQVLLKSPCQPTAIDDDKTHDHKS